MSVRIKHTQAKVKVKLKEKVSKYAISTKKDDVSLPGVIVFSGTRGSGKTYACISLMRHFEKMGYITRTFLLCPTRQSNDLYSNLRTLDPRDSYEDENKFQEDLKHVIDEVKKDWRLYDECSEHWRIVHKAQMFPSRLTLKEQSFLESMGGQALRPCRKPSHMLIIDDAQGTGLYSNARQDVLTHMVIKHRHIPISITMLAQSWVGKPRAIRLNTTQFAVFKTGDRTQLKQIYDTFANTVEYEQFERIYKTATEEPHGFLFIDTVPKKEYKRFRSGFNKYIA